MARMRFPAKAMVKQNHQTSMKEKEYALYASLADTNNINTTMKVS